MYNLNAEQEDKFLVAPMQNVVFENVKQSFCCAFRFVDLCLSDLCLSDLCLSDLCLSDLSLLSL